MSEEISGFGYLKDADGVVTVSMDLDGPVNTMGRQYRRAMAATVTRLEQETGLTGVIIASGKASFFAGADLKELLEVQPGQEAAQFDLIEDEIKAPLRKLEKLEVPVVAAINGAALGGGLEICLACNHRIAWDAHPVKLGFPEVTLGLLPGAGGVVRTVHLLGLEAALPLLLEGRQLSALQATSIGLVDDTVADLQALLPAAKAWIMDNRESSQQPWDVRGHKIPGGNIWNPRVTNILAAAPPMLFKETRGLLPAPEHILAVAAEAVTVDFDTALRIESRTFAFLCTTPQAINMITSGFFQMNQVKSGASRPQGIPKSPVGKLGILGAGMMGQGIAYAAAIRGLSVVLKDLSLDAAEKGKAYSAKLLDKEVQRGRKTVADTEEILRQIVPTEKDEDLRGCDLIIEAVFEDIALKARVLPAAEAFLASGGVLASNTSSLPIAMLAEKSKTPENFIGIHFFSPVEKMPLVEIICGPKTSDETLAKAFDFARQIGKTPIVVNDALGFFTTRVFSTYLDEGARLLEEGVDPVLLEAMGRQLGMPVGPLAIQDEVGQQLTKHLADSHQALGLTGSKSDSSASARVCTRMIADFGRGGRHHGGGFYDYPADGEKQIWPGLYELYFNQETELPQADIKDRLLFRQVIESLKCLDEGVLRSVADGNIGSLLGIGAPAWTGGFIQFVNTFGLQRFMDRCAELAEIYGDRFHPPRIVASTLSRGESFR